MKDAAAISKAAYRINFRMSAFFFDHLLLQYHHTHDQHRIKEAECGGVAHIIILECLFIDIEYGGKSLVQRATAGHDIGFDKKGETTDGRQDHYHKNSRVDH